MPDVIYVLRACREQLLNITYAQNQLTRAAKKLERADKSAHSKVKRCLEKGKIDDAKREAMVRVFFGWFVITQSCRG